MLRLMCKHLEKMANNQEQIKRLQKRARLLSFFVFPCQFLAFAGIGFAGYMLYVEQPLIAIPGVILCVFFLLISVICHFFCEMTEQKIKELHDQDYISGK
jgi:ABC-type bacteriocin/lantibiotic exporter with double-glycine peptidase domain